jgi:hypothetical protein
MSMRPRRADHRVIRTGCSAKFGPASDIILESASLPKQTLIIDLLKELCKK